MDFLNKAFAQLTDLFRSMTPATRITTVALFGVLIASVVFLFRFGVVSSDSYLFGGRVLDQDEIVRLETAFSQAGLSNWEVVGNRVRVPSGQRHTFIAAAADGSALPKDFDMILEESMKNSNPFESGQARDAKYKAQREQLLKSICNDLHGIEKARVTIHEGRSTPFNRDVKTTAMVAAQSERNEHLSGEQVETLRQTVAASIGTAPENVTVTDLRGSTYPGTSAAGSFGSPDYIKAKIIFEKEFQEKFANALLYIPGAMVNVNVELNTKLQQKTQSQQYSGAQPVRSVTTKSKSTNRNESSGGRPGAVPNGVIANRPEEVAATSSGGSESITDDLHEESESQLGQEITEFMEAGLTPKEVIAAIQIPKSYFLTIWQQRNPTTDGTAPKKPDPTKLAQIEADEIIRIRDSVIQNLIPRLPLGKDPRPSVSVSSYEPVEEPAPVEPGFGAQAGSFFMTNWRTMGLALMAMISLLMVRSMVRGGQRAVGAASSQPAAAAAPSPALSAARNEPREEVPAPATAAKPASAMLKRKFSASGPNLRDELAELVREDPDAAAAIISNWIGDAV